MGSLKAAAGSIAGPGATRNKDIRISLCLARPAATGVTKGGERLAGVADQIVFPRRFGGDQTLGPSELAGDGLAGGDVVEIAQAGEQLLQGVQESLGPAGMAEQADA